MHILFCRHVWAELSLLFWTFLSGTFFPGGGGGGARAPSAPPCIRTWVSVVNDFGHSFVGFGAFCYGFAVFAISQCLPLTGASSRNNFSIKLEVKSEHDAAV